jgi:hypothetical protein
VETAAKLLDHLNDFTQLIREDATRRLVEDLAEAASNDSNESERAMKGNKDKNNAFMDMPPRLSNITLKMGTHHPTGILDVSLTQRSMVTTLTHIGGGRTLSAMMEKKESQKASHGSLQLHSVMVEVRLVSPGIVPSI